MDIIEEHPDLIKFDNDSYYNRRMQINFADNVLLEFIKEALTTLDFSSDIYSITEIPCDNGSTKNWLIEFDLDHDDDFHYYFNYNTYRLQKTNIVKMSYFEGFENFVEFYDVGTSRTKYCRNIIILLKHYFLKLERAKLARYLSREQLLLLTYSCINNYDNFTPEDIEQINLDKTTSKKRRVLENPWALRELLEYIDA
jgi:hypothetical protein